MARQTANNGANQAATGKGVTFTRQAAQRIAKVVRTVEGGSRNQPGIVFDHPMPSSGGGVTFRVATFTGSWSLQSTKTVTFYNVTTTPNTVAVNNLLMSVPSLSSTTNSPTICFIARSGADWHLLNVQHATQNVVTGVLLGASQLEFTRRTIAAVGVSVATSAISVTNCETEAASAEQLNWFLE